MFPAHFYRCNFLFSTFSLLLCLAIVSSCPSLPSSSQKSLSSPIHCIYPSVTTFPIPLYSLFSCEILQKRFAFMSPDIKLLGWCWSNFRGNFILVTLCTFLSFLRNDILLNFFSQGLDFCLRSLIFALSFQPADITFCFKTLRHFPDKKDNWNWNLHQALLLLQSRVARPKYISQNFFQQALSQYPNHQALWEC